uniref:Uncharacterized protein n=1 Tax=Arundo donax TaxID=35708 RepID=A0A0A9BPB2_ARUDO
MRLALALCYRSLFHIILIGHTYLYSLFLYPLPIFSYDEQCSAGEVRNTPVSYSKL